MKFINFAIVKFSVFLTLGILTAYFLQNSPVFFLPVILGLFVILLIIWRIGLKQLFPYASFGIISYLCFFSIGYFNYQLRLPRFLPDYYSHHAEANTPALLQLKIKETLKPDNYNVKYIVEAEAIQGISTSGKLLLNIQKEVGLKEYVTDDVLLVYTSYMKIPKPLNPYQFKYARYMETLEVYHQLQISKRHILQESKGTITLRGAAEKYRAYSIKKLQNSPIETEERSIIQALVLGQRKDIDTKTYSDYAAAGAIHILAVSGLHVGILFLLLSGLLKPLEYLPKGLIIKSLLIILFLWCFALIAGLTPSVVRAVTMFSFFSFAKYNNRPTNSINTLFLSYFVLLLFNPQWLFHIGFQLSYLAVLFILWVQPGLFQLCIPKNFILKKIWAIFTVTIAAQLGIMPLSLYYFHQFPGLFMLTNIVVLPFLGILLAGGILTIILAILDMLPNTLALAYNYLIELLNNFINWVARQDDLLFQDISFSRVKVITGYLVIISLVFLWKKINYKRIALSLISLNLFIGVLIWNSYRLSGHQLIIFNKSRHTLIGYKNATDLLLFRSDSTQSYRNKFPIKEYCIAQNISTYSEEKTLPVFLYGNKQVLVLDSLGAYPKISKTDVLVLTHNPKIHLERLIDSLQPKYIIADGSNYISYVNRWRITCKIRKLPFHHTGTKGAFIIE